MYPYTIFSIFGYDVNLYEVFGYLSIISAIILFRIYTDKKNMPIKVQTKLLYISLASIFVGFYSSWFFQMIYNLFEKGFKEITSFSDLLNFMKNSVGITAMGGFVGGAGMFLICYKIFGKKEDFGQFKMTLNIAPCCITLAHAIGRIGCFFGGCCYGKETDFLGITFIGNDHAVIPTMLYESIFLFILFAILSYLYFKNYNFNMPIYMIGYGIFRFILEFFRADPRGAFFIPFLSPSQTLSALLIIGGGILLYFTLKKKKYKF